MDEPQRPGGPLDIVTFGCRLNAYESEVIREGAEAAGLGDAVVFNTCAVTAEATRQARQAIRRMRRDRPGARIIVTGCAAQIEPETFAAMDEVDLVIGNTHKTRPEAWRDATATLGRSADFGISRDEKVVVDDIMSVRETALHLIGGMDRQTRAYVQVQNGCDHRCTFCIIPFGRGNSRSVPMGEVVDQVARLVEAGHKEVVITGVDITSYGADLPGQPRLGTLLAAILKHVPDLPRLRLSSIDSVEADPALLDLLASDERLMPHLHLSLQAGDDLILKRMKRRHLRADAIKFCRKISALRPDIVFGADIIAGFPTETEEMFQRSLDLVEECGITHLHVFPFSARDGTPAARMPQVHHREVKSRAARLRVAGDRALARHLEGQIGRDHVVLAEAGAQARTAGFTLVRLPMPIKPGTLLPVTIASHDGRYLHAA